MKALWRLLRELLHEPPPPRPTGHRPHPYRPRRHDGEEEGREPDDADDGAAPPTVPHDPHHH